MQTEILMTNNFLINIFENLTPFSFNVCNNYNLKTVLNAV